MLANREGGGANPKDSQKASVTLTIPVLAAVAAACNTYKIIKLPVVKLTLFPLKGGKNRLKKG
jgi:hypothetical protein